MDVGNTVDSSRLANCIAGVRYPIGPVVTIDGRRPGSPEEVERAAVPVPEVCVGDDNGFGNLDMDFAFAWLAASLCRQRHVHEVFAATQPGHRAAAVLFLPSGPAYT